MGTLYNSARGVQFSAPVIVGLLVVNCGLTGGLGVLAMLTAARCGRCRRRARRTRPQFLSSITFDRARGVF